MATVSAAERFYCVHLQKEGIGSIYERIAVGRLMQNLIDRYGYTSVLEYGCPITKGYDNSTFLDRGISTTVADENVERIQAGWQYPRRPAFIAPDVASAADLVWNFAIVQRDGGVLAPMKTLAKKHILVFVPNIMNVGTPVHFAYHLLTGTACRHAEQGDVRARTRSGLVRLLADRGIEVIESGYVDAPPLPNISFSIHELRQTMGWLQKNGHSEAPAADPDAVWRRAEMMRRFEDSPLILPFRPLVAHHIWALGRPL